MFHGATSIHGDGPRNTRLVSRHQFDLQTKGNIEYHGILLTSNRIEIFFFSLLTVNNKNNKNF